MSSLSVKHQFSSRFWVIVLWSLKDFAIFFRAVRSLIKNQFAFKFSPLSRQCNKDSSLRSRKSLQPIISILLVSRSTLLSENFHPENISEPFWNETETKKISKTSISQYYRALARKEFCLLCFFRSLDRNHDKCKMSLLSLP